MRSIGVLALQGDYAAHASALGRAGVVTAEVRTLAEIEAAEGLILPGGESTVMGSLLVRFGLMAGLIERIKGGMPVFGTCAGLILLASQVDGRDQPGIRLLDVTVLRNAYGRQIASFRAPVSTMIPGAALIEGIFIRAPRITHVGQGVEILAEREGDPLIVRQGNILGCTFHPELIEGGAIHRWFASF